MADAGAAGHAGTARAATFVDVDGDGRYTARDGQYYGVRLALAAYVGSSILAPAGAAPHASAQLVQAVATRFGASLSQRGAAQLMPVIGALGAATINAIFMHHFQDMARGHFTVRRLERKYGAEVVRGHYEQLSAAT